MTALALAAEKGLYEVVEAITSKETDATTADKQGRTLLHKAASSGDTRTLTLLAEAVGRGKGAAKADFGAKDQEGNTPLHLAVLNGHDKVESDDVARVVVLTAVVCRWWIRW